MAPTPISVVQAAKATPAKYTFAGGSEVLLESAYAEFDGSAAGASWLPSLAVYSPSGVLLGRGFPADAVAAGGSAKVTFAPFPIAAAAAAATTVALPWAQYTAPALVSNPVPGGGFADALWDFMRTNDNTVFTLTGTGVKAARVLIAGVYACFIEEILAAQPNAFTARVGISAAPFNNLDAPQGVFTVGQNKWELPGGAATFLLDQLSAVNTWQTGTSQFPWYVKGRILADADTWTGSLTLVIVRIGGRQTTQLP